MYFGLQVFPLITLSSRGGNGSWGMNYWTLEEKNLRPKPFIFPGKPPNVEITKIFNMSEFSNACGIFKKMIWKTPQKPQLPNKKWRKKYVLREGKMKTIDIKDEIYPINIKWKKFASEWRPTGVQYPTTRIALGTGTHWGQTLVSRVLTRNKHQTKKINIKRGVGVDYLLPWASFSTTCGEGSPYLFGIVHGQSA